MHTSNSTYVKLNLCVLIHFPYSTQYLQKLLNITRARFPNDTALSNLSSLGLSDIPTYGKYIQVALGVATNLDSAPSEFSVSDLLAIVPTNPTLKDLATYIYNRIMALETDPNAPIYFRPRLEMQAPSRRIGFDLRLNFNGMFFFSIPLSVVFVSLLSVVHK